MADSQRTPFYSDESVTLHHGDCLGVLRSLPDCSVDSVVTDPPYGLEFMGAQWDSFKTGGKQPKIGVADGSPHRRNAGTPSWAGSGNPACTNCGGTKYDRSNGRGCSCESPTFPVESAKPNQAFGAWCTEWSAECLRVLKPGGHMVAFGGSRTWHRLAAAVEDAGFEIRDSIAWLYGSGFPKSMNVAKAITGTQLGHGGNSGAIRRATMGDDYEPSGVQGNRDGVTRRSDTGMADRDLPLTPDAEQWQGWGTALKPAFEPIVVGRKPLAGTVAANILGHGTGALNIDATRTDAGQRPLVVSDRREGNEVYGDGLQGSRAVEGGTTLGRWPTNVLLDDSQAAELDRQSGTSVSRVGKPRGAAAGEGWGMTATGAEYADTGGASRFFPTFRYEAKAPTSERPRSEDGTAHPTVKPLDLMRWLVRLVTPPGGVVLEPFAGSGTTAEACILEGFQCIAIEREADYLPLIVQRISKPLQVGLDFGEVS